MSHFKDLSTYEYFPTKGDADYVNIGWLSAEHDFSVGEIEKNLLSKLRKLAKNPENVTRGIHFCEFCDPPIFSPRGDNFVCTLIKDAPNGNGEIRVKGKNNKTYIAPVLIAHYIELHKYLPPHEFLEALENA